MDSQVCENYQVYTSCPNEQKVKAFTCAAAAAAVIGAFPILHSKDAESEPCWKAGDVERQREV